MYIYIYCSCHIFTKFPVVYRIYPVGNNRRTVDTSTSPHIFDQLGTENACYVYLSSCYDFWFAKICMDMNVIYRNATILETVSIAS